MNDHFRGLQLRAIALCVTASLPVFLSSCKTAELVPKIPGLEPYRMTIQQGNFLSQEMVAQLKLGMTRDQVRFVLGTPLLMDVFHADRWDYVYTREAPGGKKEQRNLSVVFEKDKLVRVVGDLLPPEGTAAQPTGFVPLTKPDAPVKPAAAAAKPAAEAVKPAAEAPKAPEVPKAEAEAPKPAVEAPKPAVEAPKATAESAKPAADAPKAAAEAPNPEPGNWETKQNWGSPASEPEKQPVASDEAKKTDDSAQKPAEDAQEPGFFGRLRQKMGL